MPWPLPALLTWAVAWGMFHVEQALGLPVWVAVSTATLAGLLASVLGTTPWRRALIAGGFPLSVLLTGSLALAGWVWLLPLLLVLLVYPLNAWRDAPLFPTPVEALQGLPGLAPLADQATILDGGCGLGDALKALRRVYPQCRFHGVEWSWPLRVLCAWRCPWARIRQGDLWQADWRPYAMVYLFQRPESMARAAAKAAAELAPGAWLVSLEFALPDVLPQAELLAPDGRTVWIYRAPLQPCEPLSNG
jgi:hypothetical protein